MKFLRDGKKLIIKYGDVKENYVYQNYHVIKGGRILSLGKLSSEETCSVLISNTVNGQFQKS